MTLSPYIVTIYTKQDSPYNVIPNAAIEIRERLANGTSGSLSTIYEDQEGLIPITQIGAKANSNGQFTFYAAAASYNALYESQTIPVDVGVTVDTLPSAMINNLSLPYVFDTVADYKAFPTAFPVGKVIKILDRGAEFKVISGTGTANEFDVIASSTTSQSVQLVLNYNLTLKSFGAVGDNVIDDFNAITAAITKAKTLPFGALIQGDRDKQYKTTNEILIDAENIVLDLQGGRLVADFASGWAVLVGDGVTALGGLGIRNALIATSRAEATLNGVKFRKNVRRQVAYENLRVGAFKGIGVEFEELNWSLQGGVSPLIEDCGTNLVIGDNVNAITISGIGLKGAITNNCVIRGAFQVTFVGGFIQEAGVAGVDIDTGPVQITDSVCFFGTYFEFNGSNHIVARNGKSLTATGCYMNCTGQAGAAIALLGWTGADINGNSPVGLSVGTQRDFVYADDSCSLIDVGKQNVATKSDSNVCQTAGSSKLGLVGAYNTELDVLPTASNVNIGSIVQYVPSGLGSSRPYIARTNASADRRFSELALKPVKSAAAGGGATLTPNLSSAGTYDISMTSNMTINAPTGEFKDGDSFTIILKQDGVGARSVTWNAIYKTDYTNTGNTAGTYMSRTFIYSAGRTLWIQSGGLNWT